MRVTAYSGSAFSADLRPRQRIYQKSEPSPESRSLVVQPAPRTPVSGSAPTGRPSASFLAQLIAKAENMPETRLKRRIDPAEGASVYRAAMGGAPAQRSLRTI